MWKLISKSNVLHQDQCNSQYVDRLRVELPDSSPVEKDLRIPMDEKLDVSQQHILTAQKASGNLGCI